jgi:hypothetical protein
MGLISDFLGKTAQRKADAAYGQATGEVNRGYDAGDAHYAGAEGYYTPYAQVGQQGIADNQTYSDILNNRGDAVAKFSSNPLFSGELGSNFMAAQRAGNAAGWGAGKEALAGQRVFAQTSGNWLDRYRDSAQQNINTGLNATNAMAGYRAGRGDMAIGRGTTLAGNTINKGNFDAANSMTGVNNIMGVASLGVNALNAFRQPKLR